MIHTLTCIGECHLGLQQAEEAVDPLERSLDLLENSEATDTELARVRFALARALATVEDHVNRARSLARQARDGFADGDRAARTMVDQVDDFLAKKKSS